MSSTTASSSPVTGWRSTGASDAPKTTSPALSIYIRRERATVIVTLEGLLDEASSPVLVDLLWDLVAGQGNLSVTVDTRRLRLSDPVLACMFQVLELEAALRGGTVAVVDAPSASATTLNDRRARRAAARERAAHPAGGARTTQTRMERSRR
jgi:hypothetical protein